MTGTPCPRPRELERAYWSADARVRGHAELCAACGYAWREIDTLAKLGRPIEPAPLAPRRREDMRTALLAGHATRRASTRPAPARRIAPAFAVAAAALALGWWVWPRANAPASARHGTVVAHAEARYVTAGGALDELVRLIDGTLSIQVADLDAGERFRVVTGDAEVEVRGTTFDITAEDDALRAVRVLHGAVEVRVAGARSELVRAGETWRRAPERGERADRAEPSTRDAGPAVGEAPDAAATSALVTAEPRRARPRRRVRSERVPSTRPDAGPANRAEDAATTARTAAQRAYDRAWHGLRRGDFDTAAAELARVIALADDPKRLEDARYWYAVALGRAGRDDRAIDALRAFLAAHVDSPRAGEASAMLGWMLFDRGELAAAARQFRAAVQSNSPTARASAAEGLRSVGLDAVEATPEPAAPPPSQP